MLRKMQSLGGKTRAKNQTAAQLRAIAMKGVAARAAKREAKSQSERKRDLVAARPPEAAA